MVATTMKAEEEKNKVVDLVEAEKKIEGVVGFKDYRDLFSFSTGLTGLIIYVFIAITTSLL